MFTLSGRSLPEDVIKFYNLLQDFIEEYTQTSTQPGIFNMGLEYFNTASSKCLMEMIEALPIESEVNWYYFKDDEDMQEAGEEMRDVVNQAKKIIFNIIEIE